MSTPFLYSPGSVLSIAELSAARIDGHVVEVGDAYIPADAAETPALRAASVSGAVPRGCAATHLTAAWIHGAVPAPPVRHAVQRTQTGRRRLDQSARVAYRDTLIGSEDLITLGGVAVTTPTRTLADLARCSDPDSRDAARALVAAGAADPDAARRWLWLHASLPHTGSALRLLAGLRTT
ncbi:hypothetical protein [Microbacterium mangrovi]|uniref:hypothetical protein n=1 Tax=Microbacterium mangrovi TaxID=1348253 RepID=UPI0006916C27|nr:hypothetical protein [Microbacterium mangrovi]